MPRRYFLHTLGCKLNQADTARLEAELRARGMAPAATPGEADLMVVNTCTVTARADADGRKALRRLSGARPGARVVAMGCYARRDPEALAALPGVHRVSPGSGPEGAVAEAEAAFGSELTVAREPYHATPAAGGRTRAYLKIQDGCNLQCSYCIIPAVRGRSRSLPPAEVVAGLRRLVGAGFIEIVLTGVNTGDYGKDLAGAGGLEDLLRSLLRVQGLGRLRLNSLEPRTVTDGIIDLLAAGGGLAPHVQVPLQSGADTVLARMRRNYRRREYLSLMERLDARVPGIGLGADVIVGFPGETDEEFEQTETLISQSPLSYLHVFSYSGRPGTSAVDLAGQVPPAVIRERAGRLRQLAVEKGAAFRRRHVGQTMEVLTLSTAAGKGVRALTGNFFEIRLPAGTATNRLLQARVLDADGDGATGVLAA